MTSMLLDLERGSTVVVFVDDVAVTVRGKFPSILIILANLMLTILNDKNLWAESHGLNLNARKTQLVFFTKKHRIPYFAALVINGTRLPIGEKTIYLQ